MDLLMKFENLNYNVFLYILTIYIYMQKYRCFPFKTGRLELIQSEMP